MVVSVGTSAQLLLREYDLSEFNLSAICSIIRERSWIEESPRAWLEKCPVRENIPPPSHDFWPDLVAFIELEYFQRVWTYQELMIAKRAFIILGRIAVPWHLARALWEAYFSTALFYLLAPSRLVSAGRMGRASDDLFIRFRQFLPDLGEKGQSALLLLSIVHRRCRDPHDYVYGLLGLLDPDMRREIKVDYSIPHGAVFASFVKLIMAKAEAWPGMEFLPFIWGHWSTVPSSSGLPSWCPDVGNLVNAKTWMACSANVELGKSVTSKYTRYAASPLVQDDRVVALNVLQIGLVERCMETCCSATVRSWTADERERSGTESLGQWILALVEAFPRVDESGGVIGCSEAINDFLWKMSLCDGEERSIVLPWTCY